MNLAEYQAEMARIKALPSGQRYPAWRAAKSARQRALNAERRQRDPDWWRAKLEYAAASRRAARAAP